MRKSVLTGIFACALIFANQADSAEAIEIATEKTNETTSSIVTIETMNETSKSPLLTMNEVEEQAEVPIEEKKPTVHIVMNNETLSTIAKQYETSWERIYSKNTQIADPNIVSAGTQIVIPEANEELPVRPAPVVVKPAVAKKQTGPKVATASATSVPHASTSGNGYVAGYCTWYVKNKRPDMPNNLGNASTWVARASAQGMSTGSTPAVGAVGQRGNHVVYVESVNSDGTVTISEMNHKGRYVHTIRTLPASYFSYIY